MVTAIALDTSQFQTGFVAASKAVLLAAAASTNSTGDATFTDTPSTLYKWSMANLQVPQCQPPSKRGSVRQTRSKEQLHAFCI